MDISSLALPLLVLSFAASAIVAMVNEHWRHGELAWLWSGLLVYTGLSGVWLALLL